MILAFQYQRQDSDRREVRDTRRASDPDAGKRVGGRGEEREAAVGSDIKEITRASER